jgi:hypothetical protein
LATKLRWFKWYGSHYLSERKTKALTLRDHGVYIIASCILWTQTDEIGRYIVNRKPGTLLDFARTISDYVVSGKRRNTQQVVNGLRTLCDAGLIEISEDGLISCPHILKQLAETRVAQYCGRKGGNPELNPTDPSMDKPPVKLEKIRKEKNKKKEVTTSSVSGGSNGTDRGSEDAPARKSGGAPRHIGETIRKLLGGWKQ